MGLLMAGFMGGMGKGLADSSETAYKQAMDEKKIAGMQEFQTQRDDAAYQRAVERDDLSYKRQTTRDTVQFDRGLESARKTLEINHELTQQFGAETMSAAQQALAASGGDIAKAMKSAPTPDAFNALQKMQSAINDNATTQSTLANGAASRAASYNSIENSRTARSDHQSDRAQAKVGNALYAEYVSAQDAAIADPSNKALSEQASKLRKQYIATSGKDPRAKQNGDYTPIMEEDDMGVKKMAGVLDKNTGEFRRSGSNGQVNSNRPEITQADISATARKYGISEQQVKDKLGIK